MILLQTEDKKIFSKKDFKIVSKRKPNNFQFENLIFAFSRFFKFGKNFNFYQNSKFRKIK